MAIGNIPCGSPVRLTQAANAAVAGGGTALAGAQAESSTTGQWAIRGFFVASTTSGTIKLTNITAGAAGSTVFLNTFTPPAAGWYECPLAGAGGLFCTMTGTIDVTFAVIE